MRADSTALVCSLSIPNRKPAFYPQLRMSRVIWAPMINSETLNAAATPLQIGFFKRFHWKTFQDFMLISCEPRRSHEGAHCAW